MTNQATLLVFYRLNSAIERGTKPDAVGCKPCHWTSRLKAAMVNASRAWKYSHSRCITFLKWQTTVSIDNTVSTRMRSSHSCDAQKPARPMFPYAPLTDRGHASAPLGVHEAWTPPPGAQRIGGEDSLQRPGAPQRWHASPTSCIRWDRVRGCCAPCWAMPRGCGGSLGVLLRLLP